MARRISGVGCVTVSDRRSTKPVSRIGRMVARTSIPLCRGPLGPYAPALPGAARALRSRSAGGSPRPTLPLCRGPLGPYAYPVTDLDELLDLAQSIVVRVMATLADTRADASADPQSLVHATKSTKTDMVTEMDLWA